MCIIFDLCGFKQRVVFLCAITSAVEKKKIKNSKKKIKCQGLYDVSKCMSNVDPSFRGAKITMTEDNMIKCQK